MNTLETLRKLFKDDQDDRVSISHYESSNGKKRDEERLKIVKKIVAENELKSVEELYYVSMLFQHSPHIDEAIKFSEKGLKLCNDNGNSLWCKKIKWLFAAATDRLLMTQGKPQKFGTQFTKTTKEEGGKWKLYDINPETTDADREKYGVKTLAESQKILEELNNGER